MNQLRIRNKNLMQSSQEALPETGELVVGYQGLVPIFAVVLDVNDKLEWFEVDFLILGDEQEVQYRLIEDDEAYVSHWARIPSVVEVEGA